MRGDGRWALFVSLLALCLVALPPEASAQLELAARAEEEGRLLDAEAAYRAALDAGGLDPASLARAHLRLGVLAGAASGEAAATAHFALALAVDPSLPAPPELPPAERARFEAQRGEGYAIDARLEGGTLHLTVRGAPAVARSVSIRAGAGSPALARPVRDGHATFAPAPGTAEVSVRALDERGNVLCERTVPVPWPSLAVSVEPAGPAAASVLACPPSGDPCAGPPSCRPASCAASGGDDPTPIVIGVVAAVLAVAAIVVVSLVVVDAQAAALWRVDRVELR